MDLLLTYVRLELPLFLNKNDYSEFDGDGLALAEWLMPSALLLTQTLGPFLTVA